MADNGCAVSDKAVIVRASDEDFLVCIGRFDGLRDLLEELDG